MLEAKELEKQNTKLQAQVSALTEQLKVTRAQCSILVANGLRRQSAKLTSRISVSAGYVVAHMRNFNHIRTIGLLKTLELPVTFQSAITCEKMLAVNIMLQHMDDQCVARQLCEISLGASQHSWMCFGIRGDAMNTPQGALSLNVCGHGRLHFSR